MGFSDRQVNALQRKLNKSFIHSRQVQGRTLSYIEGWHAIAEANRIFGFDGWDRETVETKCVLGRENRGSYHVVYVAKVRITVRAEDRVVVREGYGTGEAQGGSAGETHERALKTAETDATKRALATFGKPFGLSLYISTAQPREATFNPVRTPPIADEHRRRTAQRLGANGRYYVQAPPKVSINPDLVRPPEPSQTAQPNGRLRDGDIGSADTDATPVPQEERTAESPTPIEPGVPSHRSDQLEGPDRGPEATGSDASPPTGQTEAPPLQPKADTEQAQGAATAEISKAELQRLLIDWPKRRREPAHLEHVRSQPCLLCGRTPSDAHHLKFAQPRTMGRKVSDEFTVPLCRTHHRQLHHSGKEVEWWAVANPDVDPLQIARQLWEESQANRSAPDETAEESRE